MKFLKSEHIETILNSNHGGEGLFRLWDGILDTFPSISFEDCKEEFLDLVNYLTENKILRLVSSDELANRKEISEETKQKILKDWLERVDWDYQNDASWKMYEFDFSFLQWLKSYPIKII